MAWEAKASKALALVAVIRVEAAVVAFQVQLSCVCLLQRVLQQMRRCANPEMEDLTAVIRQKASVVVICCACVRPADSDRGG